MRLRPVDQELTRSARWTLALLTLTYIFSYADRYAMAALAQPVKQALALSDSELGLLIGLAFSGLYAVAALPLGRLADRMSRQKLMSWSLAAWSAMTCLCGLARSFTELALARVGVGIGEAGCVPSAHSLISDVVPPQRRALALGIFTSGGMIGMLVGFSAVPVLERFYGWRMAFVAVALPGFLVAALLGLTLSDPRDKVSNHSEAPTRTRITELLSVPGLAWILFGYGFVVLGTLGVNQWLPAFYERSFGLSRTTIGGALGAGQGMGSILGLLIGGYLSDRLSVRYPKWPLIQMMGAAALALPLQLLMLLSHDARISLASGFVAICVAMGGMSPQFAVVQRIAPPTARATAAALSLAAAALIGSGGGPLIVGALSDLLSAYVPGIAPLRVALVSTACFAAVMALVLYRVAAGRLSGGAPLAERWAL